MEQAPLIRLLAAATRLGTEQMHETLSTRGHPGLRPAFGYALLAVGADGCTTSELGAALGISKQGAAKLVARLTELGYLRRTSHPEDARARLLALTERGGDLLRQSAAAQRSLERSWARQVGAPEMAHLRGALETLLAGLGHADDRPLRPMW